MSGMSAVLFPGATPDGSPDRHGVGATSPSAKTLTDYNRHGNVSRPAPGGLRPPLPARACRSGDEDAMRTLEDALPYGDRIVARGLGSSEIGNPALQVRRAFRAAQSYGSHRHARR